MKQEKQLLIGGVKKLPKPGASPHTSALTKGVKKLPKGVKKLPKGVKKLPFLGPGPQCSVASKTA